MEDTAALPAAEFGFPGPLRDRLVAAILCGAKTTTTSLLIEYEVDGEALPSVGSRQRVVDSAGKAAAVIETVAVEQVPLGDVPWDHARSEGEGHADLGEWRADHERFWHGAEMRGFLRLPAFTVGEDTIVVLERFRVVETGDRR
jgi:uncharacterized protein YhfF